MKKDDNNEIIAGGNAENENAAAMKTAQELLDDDWDEDRIPIAWNSEITSNEENENVALKKSGEFVLDDDWDEDRIPIARNSSEIAKTTDFESPDWNMKKDENDEKIAGKAENGNSAIDDDWDDWDEDRIPIARNSEEINEHAELCRTLQVLAFQASQGKEFN